MGIEPTSKAWEAFILPMNYARMTLPFLFYHIPRFCKVYFYLNFFKNMTILQEDSFLLQEFHLVRRAY